MIYGNCVTLIARGGWSGFFVFISRDMRDMKSWCFWKNTELAPDIFYRVIKTENCVPCVPVFNAMEVNNLTDA